MFTKTNNPPNETNLHIWNSKQMLLLYWPWPTPETHCQRTLSSSFSQLAQLTDRTINCLNSLLNCDVFLATTKPRKFSAWNNDSILWKKEEKDTRGVRVLLQYCVNVWHFVKPARGDGADVENSTGIMKCRINSYCKKSSSMLEFLTLVVVTLGSIHSHKTQFWF